MDIKQFVPYQECVSLKELGFNYDCLGYWQVALTSQKHEEDGYSGPFGWKKGEKNFHLRYFKNGGYTDFTTENWLSVGAPLWQDVYRWFREEHQLIGTIELTLIDGEFGYRINRGDFIEPDKPLDYDGAMLECLREMIKIVKGCKKSIKLKNK